MKGQLNVKKCYGILSRSLQPVIQGTKQFYHITWTKSLSNFAKQALDLENSPHMLLKGELLM